MTPELRTYLKGERDRIVRARELCDGRPRCKGCECLLDAYTVGCKQCGWRKWNRMRRKPKTECAGCGCPIRDIRDGCRNCKERDRQRRAA